MTKDYQITKSVTKEDVKENFLSTGDAVFNKKYGLGRIKKITSKEEIEIYFLESSSLVTLPSDCLQFIKGTDEDLAVDVRLLSISELKEEIKRLSNIKDSPKGEPKRKPKVDSEVLANAIMKAMEKEGKILSVTDIMKGVSK